MRENSERGTSNEVRPEGHTLSVSFIDYDKLVADFETQAALSNGARWMMGDMVLRMTMELGRSTTMRRLFAQEGASLKRLSLATRLPLGTLEALATTSQAYSPRERNSGLSWEHHWLLLRATPGESVSSRRKWLREANRHQWTPNQLYRRVKPPARPTESRAEDRVRRLRLRLAAAEAALASQDLRSADPANPHNGVE